METTLLYEKSLRVNLPDWGAVRKTTFHKGEITEFFERDDLKDEGRIMLVKDSCTVKISDDDPDYGGQEFEDVPIIYHQKKSLCEADEDSKWGRFEDKDGKKVEPSKDEVGEKVVSIRGAALSFAVSTEDDPRYVVVMMKAGEAVAVVGHYDGDKKHKPRRPFNYFSVEGPGIDDSEGTGDTVDPGPDPYVIRVETLDSSENPEEDPDGKDLQLSDGKECEVVYEDSEDWEEDEYDLPTHSRVSFDCDEIGEEVEIDGMVCFWKEPDDEGVGGTVANAMQFDSTCVWGTVPCVTANMYVQFMDCDILPVNEEGASKCPSDWDECFSVWKDAQKEIIEACDPGGLPAYDKVRTRVVLGKNTQNGEHKIKVWLVEIGPKLLLFTSAFYLDGNTQEGNVYYWDDVIPWPWNTKTEDACEGHVLWGGRWNIDPDVHTWPICLLSNLDKPDFDNPDFNPPPDETVALEPGGDLVVTEHICMIHAVAASKNIKENIKKIAEDAWSDYQSEHGDDWFWLFCNNVHDPDYWPRYKVETNDENNEEKEFRAVYFSHEYGTEPGAEYTIAGETHVTEDEWKPFQAWLDEIDEDWEEFGPFAIRDPEQMKIKVRKYSEDEE